jgi:diguanylate cyclase (GGDEF)-like protein
MRQFCYCIVLFFIFSSLAILILAKYEKIFRVSTLENVKQNDAIVLDSELIYINQNFDRIIADLHYLKNELQTPIFEKNWDSVAKSLVTFSKVSLLYDQIRYIDNNGNEKVRINLTDNGTEIVSPLDLQNKANRYYFQKTMTLPADFVYISPLDLNIENEKIEIPFKPMIRFSIPVYDNGTICGIFVLNYRASLLLNMFLQLGSSSNGKMQLVNQDGYWLGNEDEVKNWGFMFYDKRGLTFPAEYPNEWERIINGERKFITRNGLFTAREYDFYKEINAQSISAYDKNIVKDGSWYVISYVANDEKNIRLFNQSFFSIMEYVICHYWWIFLFIIVFASLISGGLVTYFERVKIAIKKSKYDDMSGAYSRWAGEEFLQKKIDGHSKNSPFSICFMDINGLKLVNDTFGHVTGDELILVISHIIIAQLRTGDILSRFGGDEFIIVMNGDAEGSENQWQRIKTSIEKVNTEDSKPYVISVSHGISEYNEEMNLEDLLHIADKKMYAEKFEIKQNLQVIR